MTSGTVAATVDVKSNRRRIRDRYRHASLIHRYLAKQERTPAVPVINLHDLERLTRQQRLAAGKGWLNAKAKIESRMLSVLASIQVQAADAIAVLNTSPPSRRLDIGDIADDLAALESDFAAVVFDPRSQTLGVTTEPIELDGVYLGPFMIALDLPELTRSTRYAVIAKDPHPAATSDGTTHPHVCDERLCEGEGQAAIRRALAEGRLFDFYVIVRQILQTYNPDSAYISLDDWCGVECRDCGDTVDAGDCDGCSGCEARTCRDCSCVCCGCDETFCDDCTSVCEGCDSRCCSGCLKKCGRCEEPFCEPCMKGDLCDDCLEEKKAEAEAAAAAPVHAVCVGEAAIRS